MPFGIEIEFEYPGSLRLLSSIQDSLRDFAQIVDDQSLRGEGGEIVTRQLRLSECALFLDSVDSAFQRHLAVDRVSTASNNSAIHVHFSLNNTRAWHRNTNEIVRAICAGVIIEDILLNLHPARFGGNFCVPEAVSKIGYLLATVLPSMSKREASSFIRENAEKYSAVNFLPLATTSAIDANIEYRMFPSSISNEELLRALSIIEMMHYCMQGTNEFYLSGFLRELATIPLNAVLPFTDIYCGYMGEMVPEIETQHTFEYHVRNYSIFRRDHRIVVGILGRFLSYLADTGHYLSIADQEQLYNTCVQHLHRIANDVNFRARLWAMRA